MGMWVESHNPQHSGSQDRRNMSLRQAKLHSETLSQGETSISTRKNKNKKKNYFFRGVEYYNFILMWSSLSLCCLWFTHLLEFLSLCLWPNRRPINHYVSPWLRGVNVSHYHSLCGLSFSPWEEGQECNPESQPGLVIVPQRGQVL